MASYSPYGGTPVPPEYQKDYPYDPKFKEFPSPSPTPSPRGPAYYYQPPPPRPATRAHFRNTSTSGINAGYASPRGPSFSPRYTSDGQYATVNGGPPPFFDRDAAFTSPRYDPDRRPPPATPGPGTTRRNSTSVPQRPMTARPSATPRKPPAPAPARQATEADAKKHRIPPGYSLKNWDPTEEPIMLLGSVFDANSLGKWIYDWTVYHHGAGSPIGENAGELWLLLIQLSGKIKRAEEIVPKIRSRENREMVEEFIEAGERITDKLRKLLKACEAPMLRSAKQKKEGQLGKSAGVEFVETLWGADRELERTQKFMASVRVWNLRFDANCEEILRKPAM
ncbi:hypothetical protein VTJ83DRAFT_5379 [Remersonia thermophila]|uniref:Vegetative cell wall protein gp1 n=1 Tax=Remersonia thermophila TaxID=72144 RepID=A0ABR4D8V7_9PEZI